MPTTQTWPGTGTAAVEAARKQVLEDGIQSMPVRFTAQTPLGYQQMTSITAATALPSIPASATMATITVEAQAVRYRDDGVNPTASVGVLLPVGTVQTFYGAAELAALKFIAATSGAILNVAYSAAN
jgi:hypothetical protein